MIHQQNDNWLISGLRAFPTEKDSVELIGSLETAESLRPQIRAFVRAYEDAFNSHDPAAISAYYTDDADIAVCNMPSIHGGQAILDFWRKYFSESKPDKLAPENWYKTMRTILIIDEIRIINPDVALLNFVATGAPLKAESEQSPVRYARATWVVIRQGGELKIAALWVLPSEEDRVIRQSSR